MACALSLRVVELKKRQIFFTNTTASLATTTYALPAAIVANHTEAQAITVLGHGFAIASGPLVFPSSSTHETESFTAELKTCTPCRNKNGDRAVGLRLTRSPALAHSR